LFIHRDLKSSWIHILIGVRSRSN